MITVESLRRSFGDHVAVDDLSFEVRAGEAFGLLGPNGAGKTTTILMMVGATSPDAGRITIDGQADPTRPDAKRSIGIAPQELAIYPELTATENLRFFGSLYGLRGNALEQRVDWGLDFAGLADRGREPVDRFSGGMKRRLNLACALVHEPKFFFLDEPTVGVDPQSRNHIFSSIERLKADGCTLIYTTHYMEEAARLCDRVAIMDRGKLLALDTVDALIDAHGGATQVDIAFAESPADPDALLALGHDAALDGASLRFQSDDPFKSIAALDRTGLSIASMRVDRPDLERVFLNLTGRSLRD